jgi:hypothetical protein
LFGKVMERERGGGVCWVWRSQPTCPTFVLIRENLEIPLVPHLVRTKSCCWIELDWMIETDSVPIIGTIETLSSPMNVQTYKSSPIHRSGRLSFHVSIHFGGDGGDWKYRSFSNNGRQSWQLRVQKIDLKSGTSLNNDRPPRQQRVQKFDLEEGRVLNHCHFTSLRSAANRKTGMVW